MEGEVFVRIVLGVISILGVIITYMIVPFLKSKTSKEQRETIMFWVSVAVSAAEQIFNERGMGEEKKKFVVGFLVEKGIKVSLEELDVLIESAVKELNLVQQAFTE
jgi:hypothetical protein